MRERGRLLHDRPVSTSAAQPDWSVEATAEAQRRLSRQGCIRARLELTAPEAGGRRQAIQSGWLGGWEIGNEADGQRPDNDAMIVPEGQTTIEPGSSTLVRILPMTPHRWAKVRVGDVIRLRDGAGCLGSAQVVELVEPTNEHLTGRWPVASTVRFRRDIDEVPAGTLGEIIDVLGDTYEVEVLAADGGTAWVGPVPDEALELVDAPQSPTGTGSGLGAPEEAQGPDAAVWHVLDYDAAWGPFGAAFDFHPNYYEASAPAIRVPEGAVVVDLRPIFSSPRAQFAAAEAAVNASSARAFVWVCGDEELTALDWQHTPYWYSPARHVLAGTEWKVPVFPNGDYFVHTTGDLRLGTFGHPWQQWLCVWGADLVDSLGAELLAWLPRRDLLA